MVDRDNRGRLEKLVWAIRWLAAEPDAALAVVDDPRIVPDEIALDLEHWLEVARDHDLIDGPALDLLTEIDETFSKMSGQDNADLWTPAAVMSSVDWSVQRQRARVVLTLKGEARTDADLRYRV